MDILKKMGLAEEVQYWAGRVWHNVKCSACAVACACIGIVALAGVQKFWASQDFVALVAAGSVLLACGCGYIYSIMMINNHDEDEYDVYAY